MASLIISSSASPLHLTHSTPPQPAPPSPSLLNPRLPLPNSRLTQLRSRRRSRGLSLVTRAVPGTSTYIFAFVFPISLMAATVFTAIQISDKLDRQFLEELAVNQAILEAAEEDDEDGGDDDEAEIPVETETARPRSRNRPKREAEAKLPNHCSSAKPAKLMVVVDQCYDDGLEPARSSEVVSKSSLHRN